MVSSNGNVQPSLQSHQLYALPLSAHQTNGVVTRGTIAIVTRCSPCELITKMATLGAWSMICMTAHAQKHDVRVTTAWLQC